MESLVIRDYLRGKTREQIARDNNTSTGNVSSITKEWKKRIGREDAESIREFVVLVKKYGFTIGQCAEGFRISQLMNKMGIQNYNDGKEEDNGPGHDDNKEFINFVKDIYENCKTKGIDPKMVTGWIKDLLCFCSPENRPPDSLSSDPNAGYIEEPCLKACGNIQHNPIAEESRSDMRGLSSKIESGTKNEQIFENITLSDYYASTQCKDDQPGIFQTDEVLDESSFNTPFVSRVSNLVSKWKREIRELINHKKLLQTEILKLHLQRKNTKDSRDSIIKENNRILFYKNWFYSLKDELWNNHNYKLRVEDIGNFAKVLIDFKNHNYDTYDIINEYSVHNSLKGQIIEKQHVIGLLKQEERKLNGNIESLKARLDVNKKAMDTFGRLQKMGLGLPELTEIWNLIIEISTYRNIPTEEAVKAFIKDIEEHYHDKVFFEDKVKVIKSEFERIRNELPNYGENLKFQYFTEFALNRLTQNGVTFEDIITINRIFTSFANNTFFFSEIQERFKTGRESMPAIDRSIRWRMFIENLKELGDINSTIIGKKIRLKQLKKEVEEKFLVGKYARTEINLHYYY